jgi:hypothetical protein
MRPELLLLAGMLAQAPAAVTTLAPGDAVVAVVEGDRSIRGRLRAIAADSLAVDADGAPLRIPLSSVRQIDRVGDSVLGGAAIGAALGGASALGGMALACSNTGCADTSSNLDPRLGLVGALAGAGIGALIDGLHEGRTTVYRTGDAPPTLVAARQQSADPVPWMVFGRAGWAGFSDDEGSLGDGGAFGAGILMPLGRRGGLQLSYDRHNHRRDIESGAPPGLGASGGSFHGTEQVLAAKALLFFRDGKMFRPYAGLGAGLLDSRRTSEFTTFQIVGGSIVPGPTEVISYRTNELAIGFAGGGLWRLTPRLSILGDLSLDLAADGLGSSRVTVGAGYHF